LSSGVEEVVVGASGEGSLLAEGFVGVRSDRLAVAVRQAAGGTQAVVEVGVALARQDLVDPGTVGIGLGEASPRIGLEEDVETVVEIAREGGT
jgi:hypothetical protein